MTNAADEVLNHVLDAQEMPNLNSLQFEFMFYEQQQNLLYDETLISVIRN